MAQAREQDARAAQAEASLEALTAQSREQQAHVAQAEALTREQEGRAAQAEASLEALTAELARANGRAAEMAADLDSSGALAATQTREAEGLARSMRNALHIEGREAMQAATLCRQAVREIAEQHAALDACLLSMDAGGGGAAAEPPPAAAVATPLPALPAAPATLPDAAAAGPVAMTPSV